MRLLGSISTGDVVTGDSDVVTEISDLLSELVAEILRVAGSLTGARSDEGDVSGELASVLEMVDHVVLSVEDTMDVCKSPLPMSQTEWLLSLLH